uniref:Uncharacterized protein n=1 Tax=Meloidogyne enterolobii TaxID=390850 RepID=A0A6V7UGB2_MELEN|nr:unnamed protein product [Meloidogyne enterolobii]
MDSLVSTLSSISLEDPWRLWLYECNDFPQHCPPRRNIENGNGSSGKHFCGFCHQLGKLKHLFTNPFEESGDRWMNYLTKDCFYKSAQTMFRSIQFAVNRKEDNLLPSQLAKHIFFNKKYGRAFFREGIPPNYEDPQNFKGGNFQLLLLGTTGNIQLLKEFDKIFIICVKNLIGNEGGNIDKRFNGIFLRCEINPGKNLDKSIDNYSNLKDLPFMVKIELWIKDQSDYKKLLSTLIKKIEEQIKKEIKFPNEKIMRNFEYHNSSKRKEVVKKLELMRNLKIEKEINSKRLVGFKK